MSAASDTYRPSRATGLGWFWLGTGLGITVAAVAVLSAYQLTRIRSRRITEPAFEQGEVDLVHDLSVAVSESINTLAEAAGQVLQTFQNARSEIVRFGLDPSATSASSRYIWYMGEEDENDRPGA